MSDNALFLDLGSRLGKLETRADAVEGGFGRLMERLDGIEKAILSQRSNDAREAEAERNRKATDLVSSKEAEINELKEQIEKLTPKS